MEIIRLKKENSILEKKKKELLNQIHDLMTKNNSLNQEILSLRYSNKDQNISHQSNNSNTITELNKTIYSLKSKITQITKEKSDLEKKNNELKISINSYKSEKQKLFRDDSNKSNNFSEFKKKNEIWNINLTASENEKKNFKKTIQELTDKNNNLNKQLTQLKKENEKLNQKMRDIDKKKEEYKEKYNKMSKELNDEKDINIFNEQKIKDLERKIEEFLMNNEFEPKTKTHIISNINKVNEIEMDKLSKIFYHSPYYHKNTSTFSTNTTTNKAIFVNNYEEAEISPDNYVIIKQFKLTENLKWYLLKKLKNSGAKEENPPSPKHGQKNQSRRYKYFKLNSKSNNNIYNEDSYSDFIWKSNKNEKDFVNFNTDIIDNDQNENCTNKENQKKITELELNIRQLEEKLEKKENDCNRINLNYAKLFNRSKVPELSYDRLLEDNEKLREENRKLNKKIENLKINQKFIGFSFIEDDLEGSRFIDDNCFEDILDQLNNDKNKRGNYMMNYFRSHEDDKEENSNRDYKKIKQGLYNFKTDKNYLYFKKDNSKNKIFSNFKSEEKKDETSPKLNHEYLNYLDNNSKSPLKFSEIINKKAKTDFKDNSNNKISKIAETNFNNDSKKDIFPKSVRFRRTFHKSLKTNSNFENNNINNKDININNNENLGKSNNEIPENLNKKYFRSLKSEKIVEVENKKNEQKLATIQEDNTQKSKFYRGRRFYYKKKEINS